jgi:PAS domain S-box-containing protein
MYYTSFATQSRGEISMSRAVKSRAQNNSSDMLQYYQDVIDCMPNIVYLLDRNCTLTGCNKNFRSLLGLKEKKEIIGTSPYKNLVSLAHWSAERVEIFKRDDISALLSGESIYDTEEPPVFAKKGNIVYYLSSRIPLFNKNKEVIGLVGILTDITERKNMEEQLEKIKEQLQASNVEKRDSLVFPVVLQDGKKSDNRKAPNVLMVEDNTIAQKSAQALLMQLDCHVDVADSGDKAAMLFEPGKYDLVFMDIGLEDTSGYVISKKIRQLEKGTKHHVPIIALTGYEADVVKYDCVDYTMEGAITKPLTGEQAKQIIQHYIYHINIPISGLKSVK